MGEKTDKLIIAAASYDLAKLDWQSARNYYNTVYTTVRDTPYNVSFNMKDVENYKINILDKFWEQYQQAEKELNIALGKFPESLRYG